MNNFQDLINLALTIFGATADIISLIIVIQSRGKEQNEGGPVKAIAFIGFFVGLVLLFIGALGWLGVIHFSDSDDDNNGKRKGSSSSVSISESHELPYEVTNENYEKFNISSSNGSDFDRAIASSYIDKKGTHGPTKDAVDGSSNTSWQCGGDRYGTGEWLILFNPNASAVRVDKITVYNGFQSTAYNTSEKDFYYLNSRVEDFRLEFDDGSTEHFSLRDSKGAQNFTFESRDTCYVKFVIESVYAGDKYKDTCVAEVIVK